MNLRDRLRAEITDAMRAQNAERRDALRMALVAVQAVEKRDHRELPDDDVVAVLTRELRVRQESADAFRGGGRVDLAVREEAAIAILREFLPERLPEEEIRALIAAAIAETGAVSVRDLGKVMARVAPRTRGRADGKRVSELVAQALAARDLAAHDAGGHGAG